MKIYRKYKANFVVMEVVE